MLEDRDLSIDFPGAEQLEMRTDTILGKIKIIPDVRCYASYICLCIDTHKFMRLNLPVHITAATRTQIANNRDSLYPNASLDPPWKSPDEVGEESKIANKSGRATSSAKERPQQIKAII